jgi:hypothetical protein
LGESLARTPFGADDSGSLAFFSFLIVAIVELRSRPPRVDLGPSAVLDMARCSRSMSNHLFSEGYEPVGPWSILARVWVQSEWYFKSGRWPRQFLCSTQVDAYEALHTPVRVWAGPLTLSLGWRRWGHLFHGERVLAGAGDGGGARRRRHEAADAAASGRGGKASPYT